LIETKVSTPQAYLVYALWTTTS